MNLFCSRHFKLLNSIFFYKNLIMRNENDSNMQFVQSIRILITQISMVMFAINSLLRAFACNNRIYFSSIKFSFVPNFFPCIQCTLCELHYLRPKQICMIYIHKAVILSNSLLQSYAICRKSTPQYRLPIITFGHELQLKGYITSLTRAMQMWNHYCLL